MAIEFTLNGKAAKVEAAAGATLLDVLRGDLGLMGARFGCGLGQCGACMVLVAGKPVNACATEALAVAGQAVTTVEGLGTPERVTLYFTESATRLSTTRTDDKLDAVREDILARVARVRAGEFTATPSTKVCGYCDFRAMCPERAT